MVLSFGNKNKKKLFFFLCFTHLFVPLQRKNKETNYEEIISITWNSASPCRNDSL